MRFNSHLRLAKTFDKPNLNVTISTKSNNERTLLSSTRCTRFNRHYSISKPTILKSTFNKTEKLQQSLDSIRLKKSETQQKKNYFLTKRNREKIINNKYAVVSERFEKAAKIIQKVVRGYLVKKRVKPLILENSKHLLEKSLRSLKNKVNHVWMNLGHLNASAILIQKFVRGFIQRKKYIRAKNIQEKLKILRKKIAVRTILREYLKWKHQKDMRKQADFNEKVQRIAERLRILKFKPLWEKRKFNWMTIQKKYGMASITTNYKESINVTPINLISSHEEKTFICPRYVKKIKKIPKLKSKPKSKQKSNVITQRSILSINKELEENQEEIKNIKDDESDQDLLIEIPLEQIQNIYGGMEIDEFKLKSLPEGFIHKNGTFYLSVNNQLENNAKSGKTSVSHSALSKEKSVYKETSHYEKSVHNRNTEKSIEKSIHNKTAEKSIEKSIYNKIAEKSIEKSAQLKLEENSFLIKSDHKRLEENTRENPPPKETDSKRNRYAKESHLKNFEVKRKKNKKVVKKFSSHGESMSFSSESRKKVLK